MLMAANAAVTQLQLFFMFVHVCCQYSRKILERLLIIVGNKVYQDQRDVGGQAFNARVRNATIYI